MKLLILRLITLLHAAFIIFILTVPFIGSNYLLLLHLIVTPFVLLHWVVNDNNCTISLTESYIRKELFGINDVNDCLSCRLIQPIYDFKNNNKTMTDVIYIVITSLIAINALHLTYRYKTGKIPDIRSLLSF
jgi:hypothetical protein